jgi:hypothetical protein
VDRFVNVKYCSSDGCGEKRLNRWVSIPVAGLCTLLVCALLAAQMTARGEKTVLVTIRTYEVTNTMLLLFVVLSVSIAFIVIEKFKGLWPTILFGFSIPSTLYTFIKVAALTP